MKFKTTLLLLLSFASIAYAQTQFLNTQFGNNGLLCTNSPGFTLQMGDLLRINGTLYGVTNFSDHYLVKLTATGGLDNSFGNNGYQPLNIGSGEGGLGFNNVILNETPDNNILVVTHFYGQFNHNFITKTDLNGNVITTFGNNGYIPTWGTDRIVFHSAEIVNNEIVLVGTGHSTGETETPYGYLIVIKYDLEGNLITTFGDNGSIMVDIDPDFFVKSVQYLQETEELIVLADDFSQDNGLNFIAKYNLADNTLDTSFGTNGYITYVIPENEGEEIIWPTELLVHSNNIYLAGSQGTDFYEANVFIRKFNLDGQPDTNFGEGGIFEYDIPDAGYNTVTSIKMQNNHITLTGGFNPLNTNYENIFLIRATDNGMPVTSFGNNGLIKNPLYLSVYVGICETLIESENLITIATTSLSCSPNVDPKPAIIQFIAGTLSMGKTEVKQDLTFYPNPVKDILYLNSETEIEKVEVYDITGKKIFNFSGPKINVLSLNDLLQGVYLLRVYSRNKTEVIKIIKE